MEDGVCVVAPLSKDEEVLAGAWGQVTVQLQIEVTEVGVQPHVTLLAGVALHPNLLPLVASDDLDCCGCERPRGSTYNHNKKKNKSLFCLSPLFCGSETEYPPRCRKMLRVTTLTVWR